MAALAAPDLVVAEHVTRAPARPGALAVVALVVAVVAEHFGLAVRPIGALSAE